MALYSYMDVEMSRTYFYKRVEIYDPPGTHLGERKNMALSYGKKYGPLFPHLPDGFRGDDQGRAGAGVPVFPVPKARDYRGGAFGSMTKGMLTLRFSELPTSLFAWVCEYPA